MTKFMLRDLETNDVVFEKKFADAEKANGLKVIFEKYLDSSKFQIEIKDNKTRGKSK